MSEEERVRARERERKRGEMERVSERRGLVDDGNKRMEGDAELKL